jgi:hypothetical protein
VATVGRMWEAPWEAWRLPVLKAAKSAKTSTPRHPPACLRSQALAGRPPLSPCRLGLRAPAGLGGQPPVGLRATRQPNPI